MNKPSVLPNQQISQHMQCALCTCTAGNDFTASPSKISLSTSSKRQQQLACASQLQQLSKKSIPPLNIPKILPSFPILFHSLLNLCHSPCCKQEHFQGLKDILCIQEPPFSLYKRKKMCGLHYKCVGYITHMGIHCKRRKNQKNHNSTPDLPFQVNLRQKREANECPTSGNSDILMPKCVH